jgi:NodT family efflux transporter outer membrane factor (OMF) lipoprotein
LDNWWTGFHDPLLERIVEGALQENLDLKAALARTEQARAAAREAGARLLPSVDATAQGAAQRQSLESPIGAIGRHLPGYDRDNALYDVGVGASWEADLFGGLKRGAEAAGAEAGAAEATGMGVRITVAAEAADAYLQIRGYQLRLRLAGEQVDTDAHLLDLIKQRQAEGTASDREVAQAEALLAQARATIPPLRTAREAQMNRLDVLLGDQPGTNAALLADNTEIPAVPAIPSDVTDFLRRRPDVIAAERRLAASSARIGVATAEYYPKLSLSGLLGFESLDPSRLFRGTTFQPEAAAGLRWRLFDFGRIDAEVEQAEAANREALAQYRQSVLHAAEDVEDVFVALAQKEAETGELTAEVAALKKARETSQDSYQGGVIALTDVLDADRQLLQAQDQLASAKTDAARAAVDSFRALGGGW